MSRPADHELLAVALEEARAGLAEGGIPIGAALFAADQTLLGRGHNRRVQDDDPSVHGETDAFRRAGRQRSYRGTTMVTTLSPCWFCRSSVKTPPRLEPKMSSGSRALPAGRRRSISVGSSIGEELCW